MNLEIRPHGGEELEQPPKEALMLTEAELDAIFEDKAREAYNRYEALAEFVADDPAKQTDKKKKSDKKAMEKVYRFIEDNLGSVS
jgi:hypothetical protein